MTKHTIVAITADSWVGAQNARAMAVTFGLAPTPISGFTFFVPPVSGDRDRLVGWLAERPYQWVEVEYGATRASVTRASAPTASVDSVPCPTPSPPPPTDPTTLPSSTPSTLSKSTDAQPSTAPQPTPGSPSKKKR